MTLRPMQTAETPAVRGFLHVHEAESMFLLANLAGAQPMTVWVAQNGAGVTGVLGLTARGMLLPQWPGADWRGVAALVQGRAVSGVLGPAAQARGLIAALRLHEAPSCHDADEPGFVLSLGDLQLPDCAGFTLCPLQQGDRAMLTGWRGAYLTEVFAMPPDEAAAQAAGDVARWLAVGSHRLLWRDGAPVALTGFNVELPAVVQVGGVYVPPDARGQGLARRAVALHLAEARSAGVQRAVLFAASAAAARAYRAIGFHRRGTTTLRLLEAPLLVPA